MEGRLTLLMIEKMQLKTAMKLLQLDWLLLKRQNIMSVDEERRESLYATIGNIN